MMLAFFPWVYVDADHLVGDFVLSPFRRGCSPASAGSSTQQQIDAVLEPYRINADHSTSRATLLYHKNRTLLADLTEEQAHQQFVLAELIAFSALSSRDFFGLTYTNRDSYRLVIQGFRDDSHGVLVTTRRRDGATHNMFSDGVYRELRPHHVVSGKMVLDSELLTALLRTWDTPEWGSIFEAVACFNLANTDSIQATAETEAILTIAAYQRLLKCESGKSAELLERFRASFAPHADLLPDECARRSTDDGVTAKFKRAATVRSGWLDDFYTLRGNLAHGMLAAPYPSIWNVHEHLLLSAFLLPRLLKCVLAGQGLYALTEQDYGDLDAFERLACARHFNPAKEEDVGREWSETLSHARVERWARRAVVEGALAPGEDSGRAS